MVQRQSSKLPLWKHASALRCRTTTGSSFANIMADGPSQMRSCWVMILKRMKTSCSVSSHFETFGAPTLWWKLQSSLPTIRFTARGTTSRILCATLNNSLAGRLSIGSFRSVRTDAPTSSRSFLMAKKRAAWFFLSTRIQLSRCWPKAFTSFLSGLRTRQRGDYHEDLDFKSEA